MTCGHCVMHVKKALEELEGVGSADVILDQKLANVSLEKDVDNSILEKAVADAGYTVEAIE